MSDPPRNFKGGPVGSKELDELLDKVSKYGINSLSEHGARPAAAGARRDARHPEIAKGPLCSAPRFSITICRKS